jgi:hypothetical protein
LAPAPSRKSRSLSRTFKELHAAHFLLRLALEALDELRVLRRGAEERDHGLEARAHMRRHVVVHFRRRAAQRLEHAAAHGVGDVHNALARVTAKKALKDILGCSSQRVIGRSGRAAHAIDLLPQRHISAEVAAALHSDESSELLHARI